MNYTAADEAAAAARADEGGAGGGSAPPSLPASSHRRPASSRRRPTIEELRKRAIRVKSRRKKAPGTPWVFEIRSWKTTKIVLLYPGKKRNAEKVQFNQFFKEFYGNGGDGGDGGGGDSDSDSDYSITDVAVGDSRASPAGEALGQANI